MITQTLVMKEEVEAHKFCDDCGVEVSISLRCSKAVCEYCKKDLCNKCVGHEEDCGSDYRTVWCKRCWTLGNSFRPKIEQLQKGIDSLYTEWQTKCKEK